MFDTATLFNERRAYVKKAYQAPKMLIEEFRLADVLMASCDIKMLHASMYTCISEPLDGPNYPMSFAFLGYLGNWEVGPCYDGSVWADYWAWDNIEDPYNGAGICYTSANGGMTFFKS